MIVGNEATCDHGMMGMQAKDIRLWVITVDGRKLLEGLSLRAGRFYKTLTIGTDRVFRKLRDSDKARPRWGDVYCCNEKRGKGEYGNGS